MTPEEKAISLARGCYQRAIATGDASVSGSELKGKARKFSGRYFRSRWSFIGRCRAAGLSPVYAGGTPRTGKRRIVGWES